MENYSVVLVEDHTLLSQAISGIVDGFEKFHIYYQCKNGSELVSRFSNPENIPDLVLMDVNMPVMNGFETTKWISDNFPGVPVLALTVEEDENTILKMLRCGAKGYLLKDVDKKTLEFALDKIMETGFYHTSNVANIIYNSMSGKRKDNPLLKDTEMVFLKLACQELTYKEIADKMNLSPKTIDGYREALFEKLNVRNRIGLVIYAIKHKIYTP